nr:heme-binding protein [Mycobacterium simiae]
MSAATLFGAAGLAWAEPEDPAPPPNCTAADLAGVSSGVAAATAAYLFTHPDVNDYFTTLRGQPRDELRDQLQQYMDANPGVHAELQSIRQPLTDFRNRCQQ